MYFVVVSDVFGLVHRVRWWISSSHLKHGFSCLGHLWNTIQLVALGNACLGPATNNVVEYSVIIELLWDSILHGITLLEVRLDYQLVISQISGVYQVRHPTFLRDILRIKLLERSFEHIICNHISRNQNTIIDAFANYILY